MAATDDRDIERQVIQAVRLLAQPGRPRQRHWAGSPETDRIIGATHPTHRHFAIWHPQPTAVGLRRGRSVETMRASRTRNSPRMAGVVAGQASGDLCGRQAEVAT